MKETFFVRAGSDTTLRQRSFFSVLYKWGGGGGGGGGAWSLISIRFHTIGRYHVKSIHN